VAAPDSTLDCWVYVYNGDVAGATRIESGAWLQRPEPADRLHRMEVHAVQRARRPIIGITLDNSDEHPTRYQGSADYATSVERAGGLPFFLPFRTDLSLIPQIVDVLDGILFSGGNDLDPSLYGEQFHPRAVPIQPDRQRFELALIAEVERRRVPALGVCLGSQLMNVHRGGSLVQYLPDLRRQEAIDHRKDPTQPNRRHPVRLEPQTVLAEAIGRAEISVNTRHKQAIRDLGRGLRVNAVAPDGVIEGIEDPSLPLFLAVQWHPENLSEEPEHLAPFKLLVEKASASRDETLTARR
jgi:putative glutamine amidotransferase